MTTGPVHGNCPELATNVEAYYPLLSEVVEPGLVELCRLRIAQLTGAAEAMITATGSGSVVPPRQLAELADWQSSTQYDAREKASLDYVEHFCYSAQAVSDAHVDALRAHLSAQQIFGLTVACWMSDSFHRLSNFLALLAPAEPAQ
jgi:hypothetical protein